MLRKLLKASRRHDPRPSVPPGQRVYAIGDIHGCADELGRLLRLIHADDAARAPADTTLVFLGDLVDRGPASATVIDQLMTLGADGGRLHFIAGNHEEIFLGALDGDVKLLKLFTRAGGRETVLSYGMTPEDYNALDYPELQAEMIRLVPAAHRRFLEAFEDMVIIGDYAFVHAGVQPEVPLAEQRRSDLRWIREPFLSHARPLEKVIVHGHTIAETVQQTPARIGIDTGAYQSGRLTAIGLEGEDRWFIDTAD
ncbi:metallophosphoesterase [Sphingomonas metalli]|uniref:Metallophosphoesterase n=1 Tax=Sphingomonas metalli TaxID=1779358 RepID=A0A916SU55_9SPHN|nr:metallophosphoesterase family protein [Sphingomonas metalli]GGB16043.1 metallophosphoesterase [Sphingomonas metalli]